MPRGQRCALEWIRSGKKHLLIGGQWVAAASGKTFETINPATEEVLTRVAEADSHDVDTAVAAARRAFEAPSWSGISPHERALYLLRIAEGIEAHAEELAAIESLDIGAPLSFTRGQVAATAERFRYYAGWTSKIHGTTNASDASRFIYMVREPMGVCALINAWNFPLVMAASKLAPALACGNTMVLKPAEQSPLTTLRLGELIQEAGVPAGVVNIVQGHGAIVGAAMAGHPDVDKIAFTGSTAVGRSIVQASAGNMKKATLELGGKSPNIIFPDADLEQAIKASALAFCRNSGQICSAGTRLLVHESVYDQVAAGVVATASVFKVGSPFALDTDLGPLISARQMDRVLAYIDTGKKEGAELMLGGSRVGEVGFFVEPTVFANVTNEMTIAREEIFGPVLSIISFKDEADAIAQANDTPYGLAAAVWTRDVSRAHRMMRAIKSGRVWINTYAEGDPVMAIGGYKQSGYGREMGAESIDAYTQTKSVLMRL
nr:aldehyde dehydrogenase family protein [Variovorax guangxiensis]